MSTNLRSALTVAAVCGLIIAAAWPIVVVPLQEKSIREGGPAGGFSKGSMWSSVDKAAKAKNQSQ